MHASVSSFAMVIFFCCFGMESIAHAGNYRIRRFRLVQGHYELPWSAPYFRAHRPSIGTGTPGASGVPFLNHSPDLIRHRRQSDFSRIGLAFDQGLGKVRGLLKCDPSRHGWLEEIDDGFDQSRPVVCEGFIQDAGAVRQIFDRETSDAICPGQSREIDRLRVDTVLRIAKEDHLLPFDLTKAVVFDDNDLQRQLLIDASHQGDALTIVACWNPGC